MADGDAPCHAHVYYAPDERDLAARLHDKFVAWSRGGGGGVPIGFVGRLADGPVGPHPLPQFEVHFPARALCEVRATIEAAGLRALLHPLTDDDLADHTTLARWIGEPLELDLTVLDPPGANRGLARFGRADF